MSANSCWVTETAQLDQVHIQQVSSSADFQASSTIYCNRTPQFSDALLSLPEDTALTKGLIKCGPVLQIDWTVHDGGQWEKGMNTAHALIEMSLKKPATCSAVAETVLQAVAVGLMNTDL